MALGRQERRGVIILTVVTLLITASGFLMRYCVPHTRPMPEQTVIYKTETVTDTVYRSAGRAGKSASKKKKSANNGRKPRRVKQSPAPVPVRDYLSDTIPSQ